jgi:mRNA-degrading endonuclease toxin of MazEF toxin-antitoxin module
VWPAEIGRKRRPVLVLTRAEVIDVRALVTVAEITSHRRGLASEVVVDHRSIGLNEESAVNCDGLHTGSAASCGRVRHDRRRGCRARSTQSRRSRRRHRTR